jgi:hypothetical protein
MFMYICLFLVLFCRNTCFFSLYGRGSEKMCQWTHTICNFHTKLHLEWWVSSLQTWSVITSFAAQETPEAQTELKRLGADKSGGSVRFPLVRPGDNNHSQHSPTSAVPNGCEVFQLSTCNNPELGHRTSDSHCPLLHVGFHNVINSQGSVFLFRRTHLSCCQYTTLVSVC